jgi:hypothetical protein
MLASGLVPMQIGVTAKPVLPSSRAADKFSIFKGISGWRSNLAQPPRRNKN